MKKVFLLIIVVNVLGQSLAIAQSWVTGVASNWDNNMKEWTIHTDSLDGELRFRWQLSDGTTTWDYSCGDDISGSISQTWAGNLGDWEIRATNGEIISMKTIWNNDFTEWRITDNETSFKLKQKWTNNKNEWEIRNETLGDIVFYTRWNDDFRDWEIQDDMVEEVGFNMRMAFIFIVLFNTAL